MNEEKSERVNVTCMCDSESNEHEKTLGTYDNESKKNTLSACDHELEEAGNVQNGLLDIYECVSKTSAS